MLLRPDVPPILSTPLPPLSDPLLPAGSAGDVRSVEPSVAAFDASSSEPPIDAATSLFFFLRKNIKNKYFANSQKELTLMHSTYLLKFPGAPATFKARRLCKARFPAP